MLRPDYPIRTERLFLRPITDDDMDAFYATYSNEEVMRYLYQEPFTRHETVEWFATRAGSTIEEEGQKINLAVVHQEGGVVVGDVVFCYTSAVHKSGEIGFVIGPEYQGKGYATEAARPLLRLAFEGLGLHRVVGRTEARNVGSARVMERLGMRLEAHLIENEWVKNEWQSELDYAILESEWRAGGS